VFHYSRLHGQAALQAILAAVCVYGWWSWHQGSHASSRLAVSRASPMVLAAVVATTTVTTVGVALLLRNSTDAVQPFWDAGLFAASLAAQWMAARKWLENWLVWIVVNVVSVPFFAWQGLGWTTTALYLLYLAMAFVGYRAWKRSLVRQA